MASKDNPILGGDERLKKSDGEVERGDRSGADLERTDADGTAFTGSERISNFRDEWTSNALPTPPEIPGYHCCWLSTTNSYDPIHKRMRMGYEAVRADEVPGFEVYKMRSGDFEGFVACNEMVLFKISKSIYQEMMTYFHHERPLEDEAMLKDNPALKDAQARPVVATPEDDGFSKLAQNKRPPVFN